MYWVRIIYTYILGDNYMKKIIIKIKSDPKNILKETPEQRKERLKFSKSMSSKVVPNKKKLYNRNKFKKFDY